MATALAYPPTRYRTYSRSKSPISPWPGVYHLDAGTGGVFASENIAQLPNWVATPVIEIKRAHQTLFADTRSVRDHLLNVRDTFRLNMTELAQVFGVTRPAAYAWLEGVEPKPEARMLILSLSRAADRLAKAGIERPELYVRRPMFDGKSLIDLLKEERNVDDAISAIEALAKKEAIVRKEALTRHAGRPKRQLESLDALTTPLMRDRD